MTSHENSCPQCSAHVSPGADWCTLCYADLRPAPPVVEEPTPAHERAPVAEAVPAPVGELAGGGRGKHARGAYDDVASPQDDAASLGAASTASTATATRDDRRSADIEARADEMLAILAAQSPHPLGPLAGRLDSTRARVAVGAAGLVALALVLVVVMTVLGLLL